MRKRKKVIIIAAAFLLLGITYFGVKYGKILLYGDDYKSFLKGEETCEEGKEFTALKEEQSSVNGMVLAAENNVLKLYVKKDTAEIAVYDKRNGQTVYSNPQDREEDALASGVNAEALNSQLIIDYYNENRFSVSMNSYKYCTQNGQFEIEGLKDGLRIIYTIGDLSSSTGIVPQYITEERLKSLVLGKLTEKDAKTVKGKYMKSSNAEGFLELTPAVIKSTSLMKKLNILFEQAGYTQENFLEEKAAAGDGGEEPVSFTIPLEYKLKDDKLLVSLLTDRIVERGNGKLYDIQLLNYFGAAGKEENGYMLVPNGSGSLIHFNNGSKAESYNQAIYGTDATAAKYVVLEKTQKARLPVFGIKKEKSAVFAILEKGDALASLIADVAGKVNSYNYVYPVFTLRQSELLSMLGSTGGDADLPIVEDELYHYEIAVSYAFLTEDEADYSGMASYYRNLLLKDGVLKAKKEEEASPLYLDVIGGIPKKAFFAGIPYTEVYPMTTFRQAREIAEEFVKDDVTNLRINYRGWFNGGYFQDAPDSVKVLGELGGKNELKELMEYVEAAGGRVYGDTAFQKMSFKTKGFLPNFEGSKYYSGILVALGSVNPSTLRQTSSMGYDENLYNILSPRFLNIYIENYSKKITKIPISGISLRDLGDSLQSDKKRGGFVNREEAKTLVDKGFQTLKATGLPIMVKGGDYYSLAYADDIIGAPEGSSDFYVTDKEVPFYQMVIHGLINYTGEAINLSDYYDRQDVILDLIEKGASPRFTLTYRDSGDMKYTGANSFYATYYGNWMEEALSVYREVNSVLSKVKDSFMVEHQEPVEGVQKITYDNGMVIYINRNSTEMTVDGITLKEQSYGYGEAGR